MPQESQSVERVVTWRLPETQPEPVMVCKRQRLVYDNLRISLGTLNWALTACNYSPIRRTLRLLLLKSINSHSN
jgi:hypothetical protein